MKPLFRLAFAGLLFLGPASAFAGPAPRSRAKELRAIAQYDSLSAAQELLANPSQQEDWERNDPTGFRSAFAAAAELKDLADLLMGKPEPRAIRLGLDQRPRCKFCNNPARLEAWFKREVPGTDERRVHALREATWGWEFVPETARKALVENSLNEAAWDALDFPQRMAHLQEWGDAELAAILAATPRTPSEYAALERRAHAISGIVGNSDSSRLWEHVNHARQAVNALARAAKLVEGNPAQSKALEETRAADVDGMLAGLNKIYDGAGVNDPALRAAAPPKKSQLFDDSSREMVAGLLRTGLMNETKGTFAGQELEEFYKTNRLDLRVAAPMEGQENWIGWHHEGVITFNEKYIAEYLKVANKDIADLAREPELLRRLTVQLSPLFVHEATHHRQRVWAREQGLDWTGGQNLELESMQADALFTLEKRVRDPSFDALLRHEQATSLLARESLSKSERLAHGTQGFRDSINAWHYPELLSLEGNVWCNIKWHREMANDLAKELARRDALGPIDRVRLRLWADGQVLDRIDDQVKWRRSLQKVGTQQLREALARHRGEVASVPASYDAYRQRLERVNAQTAERLNTVLSDPDPTRSAATHGTIPPSPAVDKEF